MAFQPDIENLLDVITRRRVPTRIPNFDPYYVPKVVARITGRALPAPPYDTKEKCRECISVLLDYCVAVRLDVISIELSGPAMPMRRHEERTGDERENYLTERDIPTIMDRSDYERYPWPEPSEMCLRDEDRMLIETGIDMIPQGMGILAHRGGIFEVINHLAGYENYCYLLKDDPPLIDEMADRIGRINLRVLEDAAEYDPINVFHMGDDIACRHGLLVQPDLLRRWVFSWIRRYTDVAHRHGKVFTFHSDGDFSAVTGDIIAAGIDGKQAFEDLSYPVTAFKKECGDRIAVLGGIDVDKLVRLPEAELRQHVRQVLAVCTLGGGYAIGSGNCFAPYIPNSQYMAMLDEAAKWPCA